MSRSWTFWAVASSMPSSEASSLSMPRAWLMSASVPLRIAAMADS